VSFKAELGLYNCPKKIFGDVQDNYAYEINGTPRGIKSLK
jgi:hypothetical protein